MDTKNILIIFLLLLAYCLNAQQTTGLTAQYARWDNTTQNYTLMPYSTSEISSDYGTRAVGGGTLFHQGIDYKPSGFQLGNDAVVALAEGDIIGISGNGNMSGLCAVLVNSSINGVNYTFSYMHLFPKNKTISGNFEFIVTNGKNVIINTALQTAISSANNHKFIYKGVQYTTANHLTVGSIIGPIGNSGLPGKSPAFHLHLALLEGNTPTLFGGRSRTESIDPWNIVSYQTTNLTGRLRTRKSNSFNRNICDEDKGSDNWNTINLDYSNNIRCHRCLQERLKQHNKQLLCQVFCKMTLTR